MTERPVILRARALEDVRETAAFYHAKGSTMAAIGFVDSLERAFRHLARHPATGSLRYAHELDIPGLRAWPLARYPQMVLFIAEPDRVDVWRVLHGQRDIPEWLRIDRLRGD